MLYFTVNQPIYTFYQQHFDSRILHAKATLTEHILYNKFYWKNKNNETKIGDGSDR